MIDVSNIGKSYGPTIALEDVSFHVGAGEVVGLLGPNGAGKTTLMRIMTGYLQADAGQVVVDGLNVANDTLAVQRSIGYLMENAPLYHEMSVQGYLKMVAELRGIPKSDRPVLLSRAIRSASLEDVLTRPIGQLSKGYRQRVGLAQTIVHEPKVLILDEPTVGLDPTQILEVRRLIGRLSEHSTVLLSTHILSEVEAVCDRVIILLNGQVRANARLSELSTTSAAVLVLGEGARDVTADLQGADGVKSVDMMHTPDGDEYRIQGVGQQDIRPEIFSMAREGDWPLRELRRDLRTLEMVFNDLVATQEALAGDQEAAEAEQDGVADGDIGDEQ